DSVSITPAPVSVSGTITANNKVYDTTTTATLNTASSTLSGIFGSDAGNVSISGGTGVFASPNVGNSIHVTATGFTLIGAAANNYVIATTSYPAGLAANITPAPLTVVGTTTADNKIYDGTTTATLNTLNDTIQGILGSDAVSLTGATGTFVTSAVGNNIPVIVTGFTLGGPSAGNYIITSMMPAGLTANIMPSPVVLNFGVAGYWYTPSSAIITDVSGMTELLPPQPINEVAPGMVIGIQSAPWKKNLDGNQFAVYANILGVPTLIYATDLPNGVSQGRSRFKNHLAGRSLHPKSLVGLRLTRQAKKIGSNRTQ
ncbi:MAG: YDG domain-containing protein, partial [Phycisphaerae bacterium]